MLTAVELFFRIFLNMTLTQLNFLINIGDSIKYHVIILQLNVELYGKLVWSYGQSVRHGWRQLLGFVIHLSGYLVEILNMVRIKVLGYGLKREHEIEGMWNEGIFLNRLLLIGRLKVIHGGYGILILLVYLREVWGEERRNFPKEEKVAKGSFLVFEEATSRFIGSIFTLIVDLFRMICFSLNIHNINFTASELIFFWKPE